jgi:hypothetical protein
MIENEVIVSKLQSEGIDEKLAGGIQFETQEALDAWVGIAKTFTTKPRGIEEYNADELKKLADEGKVKGLQALLDKTRSEAKGKPTEPAKPATEVSPELKAIQDALALITTDLKESKESTKKAQFDAYVETKTKGFDPLEVTMLKSSLPITATNAEIAAAADKYRQLMVSRGLKSYATSSSSSNPAGKLDADFSSAVKSFVTDKTTKK